MRAQAIEKVLRKILVKWETIPEDYDDYLETQNLIHKAHIILDRDDNRSASVIREMINSEE